MKRAILLIASVAAAPAALVWMLVGVLKAVPALRRADTIVYIENAGFGHMVTGPDVARRLFKGQRTIFLAFYEGRFQNPRITEIWPDITVIALKAGFTITNSLNLPVTPWVWNAVRNIVLGVIRLIAPRTTTYVPLLEMHQLLLRGRTFTSSQAHSNPGFLWPIAYFELQDRVPAPDIHVKEHDRTQIANRLTALGSTAPRRCNLYLRQKDAGPKDLANVRRSGSPLADYLPAVRLLNKAGYRVLLTGDQELPDTTYEEFRGLLVDAKHCQVEKNLFDLFASTESDIFIGEAGGGSWLPGINRIPRLLTNAFPYFFAMPYSWMHYKLVTDANGRVVPYETLFRNHSYDYDLSGLNLHNNTSEQIENAVESFLQDLSSTGSDAPTAKAIEGLPDHLWIHYGGARFSKPWLQLFETAARTS